MQLGGRLRVAGGAVCVGVAAVERNDAPTAEAELDGTTQITYAARAPRDADNFLAGVECLPASATPREARVVAQLDGLL